MLDLIIVGGGPAGAAAAVYAARKQLKTLLLASEWGGQSIVSPDIQNWIGTPSISGEALGKLLRAHVEGAAGEALSVLSPRTAVSLEKIEDGSSTPFDKLRASMLTTGVRVTDNKGETHEARALLITSGSTRRKLSVPGAAEYDQKGLTYCASCDGPLFAGQDVAVIGGGNAGFETAAQLLAYAKSVTLFNRSDTFRADPITVEKVLQHPNMNVVKNAEPVEVIGEQFVTALKYKDLASGEEQTLPVSGIFVEIGHIPNTMWAKGVIALDDLNRIITDPRTQRTSEPNIWAAGDCTDSVYHQNNIAAGDAVRALEYIYAYLRAR